MSRETQKVKCENCENIFDKLSADIKRTNHNLCSKKCTGEFKQKQSMISFFERKTIDENGCWNWTGKTNHDGYGMKKFKGKVIGVHRIAYELSYGEIGQKHVCHKCDNPSCFNPSHLFLGDHQTNMDDMFVKGRKYTKLSHNDVSEIRSSNLKNSELAKKFGVSERTIRHAKNSNSWRKLPQPPSEVQDV